MPWLSCISIGLLGSRQVQYPSNPCLSPPVLLQVGGLPSTSNRRVWSLKRSLEELSVGSAQNKNSSWDVVRRMGATLRQVHVFQQAV